MPATSGEGPIQIEVAPEDMKRILDAAKKAAPELATALRKRLRGIGKLIVDDMKKRVLQPPPTGGKSPGRHSIRRDIAAGFGVKVATAKNKQGVFVTASSAKLPAGRRPMARAYNKARFRHPVFGNRETWVPQKGNPYFGRSIKPFEGKAEQEIREALTDMAIQLRIED